MLNKSIPTRITAKKQSYAVLIGALAGAPWLFHASYSRGYDYFLWLYNAHILLDNLLRGHWPNWTAVSATGSPLFKMGGLTDALIFSIFTGTLGYDLGPRIYVFVIYCVSALGIYRLVRLWKISHNPALVAVTAYVFSWFLTYTVDYTTYLSNFLLYALMPWGALCFVLALRRESMGFLVLSSFLLFLAIAANAQVSIKFALFVVIVGLIDRGLKRCNWIKFSFSVAVYLLIAASLGLFIIVPAIDLKYEVVQLASYRSNIWVSPWMMLFGLPFSGLYIVCRKLGYDFDVDPQFLASVIHSDYVGFTILVLIVFAIIQRHDNVVVHRILYALTLSLIVYWCIVPFLPNAAWLGSTHNWAVLQTLWFSLLVAFGVEYFKRSKLVHGKHKIFSLMCISCMILELGGARILLSHFALKHESPYDLPEVDVWKEFVDNIGSHERWFTFNLDHTHYLYPVVTSNSSIANIIQLRSRKPEYDSYLQHQKDSIRNLDTTYNVSESLALLNVRYIDLPIQTFLYKSDVSNYPKAIDLLLKDEGLEYTMERPWHPSDHIYDNSIIMKKIDQLFSAKETHSFGQVIFRNERALWGFVSDFTVAIVGDTRIECEEMFEEITHIPGFRAQSILYLLLTNSEFLSIDQKVKRSLDGILPVNKNTVKSSMTHFTLNDLENLYSKYDHKESKNFGLEKLYVDDEEITLTLQNRGDAKFLFLSQQHFSNWHAICKEKDITFPTFTSGAGLTAIWVPSNIKSISYLYIVPRNEKLARIWSIATMFLCCGYGVFCWFRSIRFRNSKHRV